MFTRRMTEKLFEYIDAYNSHALRSGSHGIKCNIQIEAQSETIKKMVEAGLINNPGDYLRGTPDHEKSIREGKAMIAFEDGDGISSKFKDCTPAAKPIQETITCDLGADWDD